MRPSHLKRRLASKHWKSSSEKNATPRETEPTWLEELQNMERVSLDKFQAEIVFSQIVDDFFDI